MEPVEMGALLPYTGEELEPDEDEMPRTEDLSSEEDEDDNAQIAGDDDIAPVETIAPPRETVSSPVAASPVQPEPQDLLAGGLRFLSGLAQTLSSPEATERLVSSIVERDEKTGRSYMKIPVDDQQTVVNVMNMLGQLFKGFGK
jgi:hypothetical protein